MASSAHSPQKIKLCEHILLQQFGPITARIGSLLLKRGRLTVRDIQRFFSQAPNRSTKGPRDPFSDIGSSSNASSSAGGPAGSSSAMYGGDPNAPVPIPKRLAQQAIITLIQHGCAWHSSTDPEIGDSSQEYFEINPDEVLARLRFGRYIGIAEESLGQDAAMMVMLVLKHGKLQARDIVQQILAQENLASDASEMTPQEPLAKASANQVNGTALKPEKRKASQLDQERRQEQIKKQLAHLLYHTYLRPSTLQQHVSPRDKEIAYEAKARRELRGIPTPKDLKRIRDEVRVKIAEERDADWEGKGEHVKNTAGGVGVGESRRGLIKKQQTAMGYASATSKAAKRSKTSSISSKDKKGMDKETNGIIKQVNGGSFDPAEDYDIDLDVWLRVHYDRFDVHFRDEIMVESIREKYNSTAAEVFRHLIQAGDSISKKSVRDERSAPVSLTLLAHKLPSTMSLPKGFNRKAFGKEKSAPSRQEFLAEYCSLFAHSEDISARAKSLRFLAPAGDGSTRSASGSKVSSSFTVEFKNTAERMRKDLLRNVVEEKFGTAAVRIMNILRDKGRLEEKHISKLALISLSETRDICSRLFASSLLGLQEIPKTKDRDPAKTFFLWFVDEAKCRAWLLDHLYQTLARIGQRRNEEMRRQAPLLRKVQRSDVKLDTIGLLTEWERESWERLTTILKTLTVAEQRVEMDVFILRDLAMSVYSSESTV